MIAVGMSAQCEDSLVFVVKINRADHKKEKSSWECGKLSHPPNKSSHMADVMGDYPHLTTPASTAATPAKSTPPPRQNVSSA